MSYVGPRPSRGSSLLSIPLSDSFIDTAIELVYMVTKNQIEARLDRLEKKLETAESIDPEDIDRPRGVLSKSDREYLTGKADLSRQGRYNRKDAITERIENTVRDLSLLRVCEDESIDRALVSDEEIDDAIDFLESFRQGDPEQ